MLASFPGLRVNWGVEARSNYLPNHLHEVDAKERKKKKERTRKRGGEGIETRDLSIPWIQQVVVSIGRLDGVAVALPRERDDSRKVG